MMSPGSRDTIVRQFQKKPPLSLIEVEAEVGSHFLGRAQPSIECATDWWHDGPRNQSDSRLPSGEGNKFRQRAGQPASAVGLSLARVERFASADRELEYRPRTDCRQRRRLCSITADPGSRSHGGVGPMASTAIVSAIGNGAAFTKGREFAAGLGTGTATRVNRRQGETAGICKRGYPYLRKMFIQGALTAVFTRQTRRI